MTMPTSTTKVPIALIGLALLFRIGAFLLWPAILVGIIAVCVLGGILAVESGRFPLGLIAVPIVAIGVCGYGASLTVRTVAGHEFAAELRRDHYPKIWSFVSRVAEAVGGRAPDNIIIGLEPNFYVTQAPLRILTGRISGRTLYMSAPLLRVMEEAQVKAVLGHEFSHFTGSDTLYGSHVAPAYHSLRYGIESMKENMGRSVFMVLAFIIPIVVLWLYQIGFRVIDRALSRSRELRCDEIASEVYGQDHMAAALVKVIGYGAAMQSMNHDFATLLQQGQIFTNYPEWFGQNRASWDANFSNFIVDAYAAKTKAFDSHPALRERLTALGVVPGDLPRYTADAPPFSFDDRVAGIERRLTDEYGKVVHAMMVAASQ